MTSIITPTPTAPKAYLLDMDGVLIRGGQAIAGAAAFIARLRAAGMRFMLVTNNAAATAEAHATKLERLGIAVGAESIFTSGLAMAAHLRAERAHGRAYVVGGLGLMTAIRELGYVITDESPDYVLIGEGCPLDMAHPQLQRAVELIQQGARFIVTSPDRTVPTPTGLALAPGTMAEQITEATGVPATFVGKPTSLMFATALQRLGVQAHETLMVGDTLDTDIAGGNRNGLRTVLVLSGNTKREDVAGAQVRPTFVRASVAEIDPCRPDITYRTPMSGALHLPAVASPMFG